MLPLSLVTPNHRYLRHARHNTEFSRQLASALRANVKTKADRAAIKDLLGDDPEMPLPVIT